MRAKHAIGMMLAVAAVTPGQQAQAALALPPSGAATAALPLSAAFGAPAGWQIVATRGADDAEGVAGAGPEPGPIRLCVTHDGGRSCRPDLSGLLRVHGAADLFAQPHFVTDARIVYPQSRRALLLLQVASLHSGDGDQRVATTALRYDPMRAAFVPVYTQQTGRNRNQEIRYIASGPLRGAIVAAWPTEDAPFGYWITVNRLGPGARYQPVLHYRSATRYGDGNPLAVIDSEMPTIARRLGAWRPGAPPPLPAGPCPRPHRVRGALWCQ